MSFCDSTWDLARHFLDVRVCRQCGRAVSGHSIREKGLRRALEDAARGCAMQSAIAAMHEQVQRRIGSLWDPST